MRIAVVGGDMRYAYLARLLRKKGIDVGTLFLEQAAMTDVPCCGETWALQADYILMGWPLRCPLTEEKTTARRIFDEYSGKLIFCGPAAFDGALRCGRIAADLWDNEIFLRENARLTAEGAVHAVMDALECTAADCTCMVVGFGRIGRCAADLLRKLGAEVIVASRTPEKPAAEGYRAVCTGKMAELLPVCRAVLSTPPERVLDSHVLEHAAPDALIVDLSSAPYGVDLHAAWEKGLRAWREPGLPGRYCPASAAECIWRAIRKEVCEHGSIAR